MKSKTFNISIDSPSLNILSFLYLLQIIERTYVFCKKYGNAGFSNLLYLLQITQYNFFIFLIVENI